MNIYADTSFWTALYVPFDVHHAPARRFFGEREGETLLRSPWHRVEVFNTVRQLARAEPPILNVAEARQLIYRLDMDVRVGYYLHLEADWRDVLRTAQEISNNHAYDLPCRSADLLHVAYARELGADSFVSFDDDQLALAKAAGLKAVNPAAR
jgi:predicted nucleic acid-binding protein